MVIVDIAGDPALLRRLHERLGGAIRHSCRVGATHEASAEALSDEGMPGPKPEFFFTPDHVLARRRQWGEAELARRLGAAWRSFLEGVPRWLEFHHSAGREAVERVYRAVLGGTAPPTRADILTIE